MSVSFFASRFLHKDDSSMPQKPQPLTSSLRRHGTLLFSGRPRPAGLSIGNPLPTVPAAAPRPSCRQVCAPSMHARAKGASTAAERRTESFACCRPYTALHRFAAGPLLLKPWCAWGPHAWLQGHVPACCGTRHHRHANGRHLVGTCAPPARPRAPPLRRRHPLKTAAACQRRRCPPGLPC